MLFSSAKRKEIAKFVFIIDTAHRMQIRYVVLELPPNGILVEDRTIPEFVLSVCINA